MWAFHSIIILTFPLLYLNHNVLLLNRNRISFGHVRPLDGLGQARFSLILKYSSWLDHHLVTANSCFGWINPGLAGFNIKLPAVPGTAQNLLSTAIVVLARFSCLDQPG